MTLQEAAAALPTILLSKFGVALPVDQIDFVECEDGDIAAYVYDIAEYWVVLLIDMPDHWYANEARAALRKPRVIN